MPREFTFTCPLPNGLHARPASHIADVAERFAADVIFICEKTGAKASAKSVLELVAADIQFNDPCRVNISGRDEETAFDVISSFVRRSLARCDQPLPKPRAGRQPGVLPRLLHGAAAVCLPGTPASRGVGRGRVVFARGIVLPESLRSDPAGDPARERQAVATAVAAVRAGIEAQIARAASRAESDILKAHLSITRDPALTARMAELTASGRSAGQAVLEAAETFATRLRASENVYLRERVADLHDVCCRLLEHLYGDAVAQWQRIELCSDAVVVANQLSPRQLLALDRRYLKGLVLGDAGTTSHAVLLARSFGIPALTGLGDATHRLLPGQLVIVDADNGILVVQETEIVRRYYELEGRKTTRLAERQELLAARPAATADGRAMRVAANVASAEEVAAAVRRGAEGVGLFRTEMVFLSSPAMPTEQEQFEVYAQAIRHAAGRPVIFRTLDIGGDKPLAYLPLGTEANPFLGYRGVRVYAEHTGMFTAQAKAILRASALGPARMMLPMVASVEEVRAVKNRLGEIKAQLQAENSAFDPQMPLGIMVEVPAVAFAIGDFCDEVDFFSIGTNDLAQYFAAADRDNPRVSALCNPRQPAFLRLLKNIVDDVHAHGKRISMCGEMAREVANLPLLVGLELDEISANGPDIPAIKSHVARLASGDCATCLAAALACRTTTEVEQAMSQFAAGVPMPLLDGGMVLLDCDCRNKEEVMKVLADGLQVAGRTDDPAQVEDALWAREAVYSTGIGFGFAIPHCKTDAVVANSILVLKNRTPVEWGSLDGQGVQTAIMLAIRQSDQDQTHMRILSVLARKLMHEEFRKR
ncbi:MAG: phosphoenolpyruvate--protein phosphotransferase, partial [Tepidisphaeraceae bacterium]